MKPARRSDTYRTILGYLLCCALVPLYVNLFPLWKYLSTRFGSSSDTAFSVLPAAVLVLFLALCWFVQRLTGKRSAPIDRTALLAGATLCLVGLLVPDPGFPVKRIHVAEYAALSLAARFALSSSLSGPALLFYSSCFAAVLGIHDEFLQGLHPARTYGLRDMAVNIIGSCGGGLIWHGLNLFSPPAQGHTAAPKSRADFLYLGWLFAALLMLVWPAYYFKGQPIELWTALPLLAAVFCFFNHRKQFSPLTARGLSALTAVSAALAAYPLLSRLPGITFY
jgi:hypothetical protein